MQKQIRGPYGMAVRSSLASFKRLSKDMGWTDPLSIIFARGADQDTAIEQEVLRAIRENESAPRSSPCRPPTSRCTTCARKWRASSGIIGASVAS